MVGGVGVRFSRQDGRGVKAPCGPRRRRHQLKISEQRIGVILKIYEETGDVYQNRRARAIRSDALVTPEILEFVVQTGETP